MRRAIDPDHASSRPARARILDEMLGNLVDNACNRRRPACNRIGRRGQPVIVTIDDDGRGLEASIVAVVPAGGARPTEAAPGWLGLAIVRELADLYRGSISLGSAPAGGLRARLELPAC